jgi:hypothetical protein
MGRPVNGWTAARNTWNGVLGMYWRAPPPQKPRTFFPPTWKPIIAGKTFQSTTPSLNTTTTEGQTTSA